MDIGASCMDLAIALALGLLLAVGGLVFFNRLTWLATKLSFLNYFVW